MNNFFTYSVSGKDRFLNLDQIIYADHNGPVIRVATTLSVGSGLITIGGDAADLLREALKERQTATTSGSAPSSRVS